MAITKPALKPQSPSFSSGPCPKRPDWSPDCLAGAVLGRSHRGKAGKARLAQAIAMTRDILQVPEDYLIGIVPASDTGAFECAMWSLLGPRPVDVLVWESFSKGWATDITKQLKLEASVMTAPYGQLPDLSAVNPAHDVVFVWNGTTSGVRVPNGDWIADDRQGLTLCDGTSAAFAMNIPWKKIDAFTFSWQKCLGGEAAHGVLILSPRAVERINTYDPAWPMPKIFRLKKGDSIDKSIFEGATINTPSMLCVEDYIDALKWAGEQGGLGNLVARTKSNYAVVERWVEANPQFAFLAADPTIRSTTSVCVSLADERFTNRPIEDQRALLKQICAILEKENAALDVAAYRDAPPGFRFWCGPTIESGDLRIGLEWVAWASDQVLSA